VRRVAALGPVAWAAILGGVALLVRLPFVFQQHRVRPDKDDILFLQLSDALLRDGEFDNDYFTPGYPAFQAVLRALPGRAEDTITIAQHLLGIALVAAIVLVAWRWFGRATALLAGTLAAVTPILVVHEHTMLPDFLFGVAAFAGAVALAEGLVRDPPSTRLLVAAGALFALAAYMKPAGQFLLLAAPLAALLAGRGWRAAVRPAGIVTLVLVVAIAPWVIRNAATRDHVGMSRQDGQTLFNRVFELDRLPVPTDHEHGRLAEEVRLRAESTPDARFHVEFTNALQYERGLRWEDAIQVLREMSWTAIRRHPVDYAEGTWRQLRYEVGHLDDFSRADELQEDLDRRAPGLVEGAVRETWSAARKLVDVWWLLSLNAAAGLLLLLTGPRKRRVPAGALFAVWLGLMLGTAMAHGGLWRYSVQVAPIAWILGSGGLVLIVSAVWERLRPRQAAATAGGGAVAPALTQRAKPSRQAVRGR
jgi:hypothetical protein